jgi:glycerol uptake facilitator-like aquaporin
MVAFLFSYWVLSFLAKHVSGAHYNPAISFAFLFKREGPMSKIVVLFYLLA